MVCFGSLSFTYEDLKSLKGFKSKGRTAMKVNEHIHVQQRIFLTMFFYEV